MSLRKPEMVLFDLDGTLVDTVPDLSSCIDQMLTALDLPVRGEAKVRLWVGNGVERLVKRALTGDMHGEPDTSLLAQGLGIFMDIYRDNTCRYSTVYPGVPEVLDYLMAADFKLGVVTNKRAQFTDKLLKSLQIYDDFGIVVSGDTLPVMKPEPGPLLYAADFFSVAPVAGLMVGDSHNDVKAARAAGLQILCVSYGYNQGVDIHESNPDIVIDSLMELPDLI